MKSLGYRIFHYILTLCATLLLGGIIIAGVFYHYAAFVLPDVKVLRNIQLELPLQIFTSDGKLIGEFGEIHRIPVAYNQIPNTLIQAVLATEDQRFFEHAGVDPWGLLRASLELMMRGEITQGGSTITMQVARNFFLTRQKTFSRKINEIFIALKIDREFSKQEILNLYLNTIYLGNHAYGVGAAARIYYGKTVDQLTLPEAAMLAGLPKAPSSLNPLVNPAAAIKRRNHVLDRMYDAGYIDKNTYQKAIAAPNTASLHTLTASLKAPYVAEMVRSEMLARYGNSVYTQGYSVYTTIDSRLQQAANQAVFDGLLSFDQRHGYRGPEKHLGEPTAKNLAILNSIPTENGLKPALVTDVNKKSVTAILKTGNKITIPWQGLSWARPVNRKGYLGAAPRSAEDIVEPGDLIRVVGMSDHTWRLAQIPQAEATLVALNPNNGAIVALVGGFNFNQSKFNRVTQAVRQMGSNFKPFLYAAALAQGQTLATKINDAPIVLGEPGQPDYWRPQNDNHKFYGPISLRDALTLSRNLVSIRLLLDIGIPYTLDYVSKFGFNPAQLPHTPSLALGTGEVTPLQLVSGFAVFANGGYRVPPFFIDRVVDKQNHILFQANPKIVCDTCPAAAKPAPAISVQVAYLMTSVMQDVIRKGTGKLALMLNRKDIAGKTGTSNDQEDAWFSGFNRDLVATAWVGFDNPQTLHEYGAKAALPIWIDFMRKALAGLPEHSLAMPTGIVSMDIDPSTGLPAEKGQPGAISELFLEQFTPEEGGVVNTFSAPADVGNNTEMGDLF